MQDQNTRTAGTGQLGHDSQNMTTRTELWGQVILGKEFWDSTAGEDSGLQNISGSKFNEFSDALYTLLYSCIQKVTMCFTKSPRLKKVIKRS